jgi:hypothetical protein
MNLEASHSSLPVSNRFGTSLADDLESDQYCRRSHFRRRFIYHGRLSFQIRAPCKLTYADTVFRDRSLPLLSCGIFYSSCPYSEKCPMQLGACDILQLWFGPPR